MSLQNIFKKTNKMIINKLKVNLNYLDKLDEFEKQMTCYKRDLNERV